MDLTIIIPVFNEEKTIAQVVRKVFAVKLPVKTKEIIIVNDGSTDGTAKALSKIRSTKSNYKIIHHKLNQGKGAAVRTGIKKAKGSYIIIQDADLEYDPQDIKKLIALVASGDAQVVYGTRLNRMPDFSKDERTLRFFAHYMGNKALSLITSVFFGNWLTDMECCYKLFPKKALKNITLKARGFELEPEITAKLLKQGHKIKEVPISTNPRGYEEGKKLNTVRDGVKAVWTLVKYRFIN